MSVPRPHSRALLAACVVGLFAGTPSSSAFAKDVVTVKTDYGGSLSFLLLESDDPKAAVILFPGGDGYLGLSDTGKLRRQKKSFLVGNREAFRDQGFMVAVIDAPVGVKNLSRTYRMSEEHGQDIGAVVRELKRRADVPVWLIGHSRGTYSAANAAIRLENTVTGLILASTVTRARKRYASYKTHPDGVLNMTLASVAVPVLVVANRTDSCWSTPAANAERLAKALTGSARVAVRIFDGEDEPNRDNCKRNGQHAFYGFQDAVISSIADFIKANTK